MKLMTFSELSMTDFAKNPFPKTYQITTPLKAIDQSHFTADEILNDVTVSNIIVSNLFLKIKISQNCNVACFVWACDLVSHIEGET